MFHHQQTYSRKLTANATENEWLEDEIPFWGPACFQVRTASFLLDEDEN